MGTTQRVIDRQRLVLEILVTSGEPLHRNVVMERLEKLQPPLPDELGTYNSHPGSTKYRTSTHFYTIGLVKAGWVVKEGGMWSATADGVEALKKHRDASSFFKEMDSRYKSWKQGQSTAVDLDDASESVADVVAVEDAADAAAAQIRDYLARQSWQSFQDLVGHLLRAMGWHVVYTADQGADRGLDLVAYEDPLGAKGSRVKVQVKRYSTASVAADVVERTASKLNDNETGVIVTLSSFTKEAILSARDSKDRITLIDGTRLIQLWSENYDRIPEEGRALLRLRNVAYLNLDN
jgi:restriction system protein